MRPTDNINQSIKKLHIKASADLDGRVHDDIDRALATRQKSESADAKPNRWRIIMKSRIMKLAAAVAVIFVLLLVFNNAESTLYAQVIASMRKARTVHALGYAPQDGRMEKVNEIWYERGAGIKVAWKYDGNERVVIDNGRWRWEHRQNNHFAVRNKSLGIDGLPREITEPSRYLDKCVRDSAGDMLVDGVPCELYVGSYPGRSDSTRLMFWISHERRPRRFEERVLENGIWKTVELGQVEYDIDFDSPVFEPNFGPGVDIVDGDEMLVDTVNGTKMLDAHFSLDNAVFTKEEMGLVFAVHEIKRCQNDLIFAVTSLRPSEETIKDIESKDPRARNYGDYGFGSCWKRSDGRDTSYSPIPLGWIYHGGLMVKWTVFVPNGFEAGHVTQCEFELDYLRTEGKLAIKRTEAGLPDRKRFKPIATLPLPDEQVSLDNLIGGVYDVVKLFELIVAEECLDLRQIPFTDTEMEDFVKRVPSDGITKEWKAGNKSVRLWHGQSKKPSQIDKEHWTEDRLGYIREKQKQ